MNGFAHALSIIVCAAVLMGMGDARALVHSVAFRAHDKSTACRYVREATPLVSEPGGVVFAEEIAIVNVSVHEEGDVAFFHNVRRSHSLNDRRDGFSVDATGPNVINGMPAFALLVEVERSHLICSDASHSDLPAHIESRRGTCVGKGGDKELFVRAFNFLNVEGLNGHVGAELLLSGVFSNANRTDSGPSGKPAESERPDQKADLNLRPINLPVGRDGHTPLLAWLRDKPILIGFLTVCLGYWGALLLAIGFASGRRRWCAVFGLGGWMGAGALLLWAAN